MGLDDDDEEDEDTDVEARAAPVLLLLELGFAVGLLPLLLLELGLRNPNPPTMANAIPTSRAANPIDRYGWSLTIRSHPEIFSFDGCVVVDDEGWGCGAAGVFLCASGSPRWLTPAASWYGVITCGTPLGGGGRGLCGATRAARAGEACGSPPPPLPVARTRLLLDMSARG